MSAEKQRFCFWLSGVALFFAGCVEAPVWLPDSSGLIYTDISNDGLSTSVFHFDLATGKHVLVARKIDGVTPLPAVSPTGEYVAIGEMRKDGENASLRLHVVKIANGDVVHTSAPVEYKVGEKSLLRSVLLLWDPSDNSRILCCATNGWFGYYDANPKNRGFVEFKEAMPNQFLWMQGLSPFLPDGSGIMAQGIVKDAKGKEKIIQKYITWDGTERIIREKPPEWYLWPKYPSVIAPSRWEGKSGLIALYDTYFEFAIDRGQILKRKDEELETLFRKRKLPTHGATVCRLSDSESIILIGWDDGDEGKDKESVRKFRITLCHPDGSRDAPIKEDVLTTVENTIYSPDGKWLAIHYKKEQKRHLLILDGRGEVAHDFRY